MSKVTLTKEECQQVQDAMSAIAKIVHKLDGDLLDRYIKGTKTVSDGAMDVVLPHFFNMQDIAKGKRNLQFLRTMASKILQIQGLVDEQVKAEAAAAA